jgi:hypothetical protein
VIRKPYWSWRFWMRWFVPLPLLLRFSKKNFLSHVWYQDSTCQLELTRRYK